MKVVFESLKEPFDLLAQGGAVVGGAPLRTPQKVVERPKMHEACLEQRVPLCSFVWRHARESEAVWGRGIELPCSLMRISSCPVHVRISQETWLEERGSAAKAGRTSGLADVDGQEMDKTRARERKRSAHRRCQNGRTWDRTRDLSRVKRALSR
jgi:hypothetical protein